MALLRLNAGGKLTVNGLELKRQNVLILVDTSGSMAGGGEDENTDSKIEQAKAGAIDFVQSVKRGVSTALAIFGSRAAMVCDPMADAAQFARKISGLCTGLVGGKTNLAAGLVLANRFRALNTVVIVTDGQPDDEDAALAAADVLKRRNIELICIGTDDANTEFLAKLGKAIHVQQGDLRKAIGQARLLLKGRV